MVEARQETRVQRREKRHKRVRNKISGTAERPRLAVYRSNQHIYVQVVDDEAQSTLAAASTLALKVENGATVDAAKVRAAARPMARRAGAPSPRAPRGVGGEGLAGREDENGLYP